MPLESNFNTKLFAHDTVLTLTNSCPKPLNKNVNSELVKTYTQNNSKDFIILHVNARSLIKNFNKLKEIIFN